MKRRIVSMLMVVFMFTNLLAGCSKTDQEIGAEGKEEKDQTQDNVNEQKGEKNSEETKYPSYLNMESEFPIVKEGENVKLRVVAAQSETVGGEPEDMWLWRWTSETMNVELDVEHILSSAVEQRKQVMFAADDLPDMMFGLGLSPVDLVNYGQNEKQLLSFNEYLDPALMPATVKWLEYLPEAAALSTCPDDNMYTLPLILSEQEAVGSIPRIFIDQTWLEAVNMETPETLDDFTNMLKTFKEEDPGNVGSENVIPLGGGSEASDPRYYILKALGFMTDDSNGISPALRDGKVVIPCADELFLEYLKILNNYYEEGLISKEFFTLESTQMRAQMTENLIGVIPEPAYLSLPDSEDFQQWWAVKPLTSDYNTTKQWMGPNTIYVGNFAASSKTKYPEVIARYVDFFFTDLGAIYKLFGPPENSEDTLGMVEGWYIDDEGNYHVPEKGDGYSYRQACIYPFNAPVGNHAHKFGDEYMDLFNMRRELYGAETKEFTYNMEKGDPHYRASVVENLLPYAVDRYPHIIYLSEDENIRLTDLRTTIETFVISEVAKFITGARPLDEFDQYLEELNKLDIDEYEKIYIDAYENYKEALSE